jgi:hypothetical protein
VGELLLLLLLLLVVVVLGDTLVRCGIYHHSLMKWFLHGSFWSQHIIQ